MKRNLSLAAVYRLLEPGPVVMLSTHYKGESNIMTMSWHTMMEFEPPLIGCIVSDRDYTFELLKSSRECVINIPTQKLSKIVVGCGNTTGAKVDKFKKFKLTKLSGKKVSAPLIAECFANLECQVVDTRLVNKYNFFILEVVHAWIDKTVAMEKNPKTLHHRGHGLFMVAGKTIKIASRAK